VKDQVATILKGRQGWLKKKIEKGEEWSWNHLELHWNQLQKVLAQEDKNWEGCTDDKNPYHSKDYKSNRMN
jgi:hypothetical protein